MAKKSAARPTSATWTAAITFSAAKTVRMTTTGRGAERSRKRPVASATAMTTTKTASDGRRVERLDGEQDEPERDRGVVAGEREGEHDHEPGAAGDREHAAAAARGRARTRAGSRPATLASGGERDERAIAAAGSHAGARAWTAVTPPPPRSACRGRAPAGSRPNGAPAGRARPGSESVRVEHGRERLSVARRVERGRDRRLERVQPARAPQPGERRRPPRLPRSTTASCVCAYQLPGSRSRRAPERAVRRRRRRRRAERERAGDDVRPVAQRVQLAGPLEPLPSGAGVASQVGTARSISRAASAGQRVGRGRHDRAPP